MLAMALSSPCLEKIAIERANSEESLGGSVRISAQGVFGICPRERGISHCTTGRPRSVLNTSPKPNSISRPWRKGDPIVEPSGIYRLPSGRVVLSRECSNN
jgi:hypothetical protein